MSSNLKMSSSGLMFGNDIATYLQIPNDWYRGSIEQLHIYELNYKMMNVSLKNKDKKSIKVGV